jgi:hypothetical protein
MALTEAYNTFRKAISTAPPSDAYLKWDAPGVEILRPDEDETAYKIGETMNRMQQHNFDKHRHAYRATHVKTQGIVKGKLTVLPNLPKHLQQGLFQEPGKTYDVAARYANEPVFLQADQDPGPRGLSMRVFDVKGERLPDADPAGTTQDFFFNNAPSIELTDIDTCLDVMQMREKYFDSPTKLAAATRLRIDGLKQVAPFQLPNTNMISHSFYTQSAFRYGDWYGHMELVPVLDEMSEKNGKVKSGDSREVLRDWLAEYFANKGAKYEFRVRNEHPLLDYGSLSITRSNWVLHQITIPQRTARWFGTSLRHLIRQLRSLNSHRKTL